MVDIVPASVVARRSRRVPRYEHCNTEAMCICDRHGGYVYFRDAVWVGRMLLCRYCASEEIDRA